MHLRRHSTSESILLHAPEVLRIQRAALIHIERRELLQDGIDVALLACVRLDKHVLQKLQLGYGSIAVVIDGGQILHTLNGVSQNGLSARSA